MFYFSVFKLFIKLKIKLRWKTEVHTACPLNQVCFGTIYLCVERREFTVKALCSWKKLMIYTLNLVKKNSWWVLMIQKRAKKTKSGDFVREKYFCLCLRVLLYQELLCQGSFLIHFCFGTSFDFCLSVHISILISYWSTQCNTEL